MGYDKKIAGAARAELDRRRQTAESEAAAKLEEFFARCPRAMEVRQEMAHNAANAARAVMGGGDVRTEMEKHKAQGLALRQEYEELLAQCGMTRQDITPQYHCKECKDTGFVDGRMCQCLLRLRKQLAYRDLSDGLPLTQCQFDSFSLEYYQDDPRALERMRGILHTCRTYAGKFRANSPSLLFRGGTGLGKTHLSLAIANAAIEKGFGVVYGSAQTFVAALERERFDREGESTADRLKDCDLLILDDLGSEYSSAYVSAALYDVLNCRLLGQCPTIISTNLNLKELEERYGQRLTSRIMGEYGVMEFLGRDVRTRKRRA